MSVAAIRGTHPLWVLDDLFSPQECRELVAAANAIQDDGCNKSWHVPDNNPGKYLRAVLWDRPLAARLWDTLKPVLPSEHGGYKLLYVNPCFRFSRYRDGGWFPVHHDGKNYDKGGSESWDAESLFTLNVFLNDGFEGGQTDFFEQVKPKRGELPPPHKLRISIEPKAGRGALFWAQQLHRGNVVHPTAKAEFKYLIRTDVMGVRK